MSRKLPWLACAAVVVACSSSGGPQSPANGGGDAGPVEAGSSDSGSPDAGDPPLCANSQSVDGAYPRRNYDVAINATLPDLSFDGLAEDGSPMKIALHDYFEPCADKARLIVIRTSAGWCGTCRWHAAHTGEVKALDVGARLRWLDLVLSNEDGVPMTVAELGTWRARIDAPDRLAADPAFSLGPALLTTGPLPFIVLVDTRTMKMTDILSDPDPEALESRIRGALARLDGAPVPNPKVPQKYDGVFYRNQWDMIRDVKLPGPPPPDPTNAKADDPAAAALGLTLFEATTLSPSGSVSCASCHRRGQLFQDGSPQSHDGVALVDRNAPSITLAAHSRWQFWDGRADTLWAQALGPIENAKEFGSSRLFVDHAVFANHKTDYEAVFGPMPPLSDTTRFPSSGKPGDAAWAAMSADDQTAATQVFVNVGKAIGAYERTLRVKPNALDAYVDGDTMALTPEQKGGLFAFATLGCLQCHYGPRLTDDAFHVTRFPTGRQDKAADQGRAAGVPILLASEFRADGTFSDAPNAAHGLAGLKVELSMTGAFKTPTLRGVASSGPYGHGGTLLTLDDVATVYGTGGLSPTDMRAAGTSPPWLVNFDLQAGRRLVPFLEALTGEPTP